MNLDDPRLFTYTPSNCSPRMILVVFHGQARDAQAYRDHAKAFAAKNCAFIVAPEFPKSKFPRDLYQYGGLLDLPGGMRSIDKVQSIIDRARSMIGGARLPAVLFGHSAGAQFLSRVVAFSKNDAVLTIIANPSTWVLPNEAVSVPYGLGGVDSMPERSLRNYLGTPFVMALGGLDHGSKNLASANEASQEGADRYDRGMKTYQSGRAAADGHSWPFCWRLIVVPNVGHDAKAMLDSREIQSVVDETFSRLNGQ